MYCHALIVVDDFEFHERASPLTLGQQRAVAASLNTLVFRTQLPHLAGGEAAGPRAGAAGGQLGRDYVMLRQAAPLLHRQARRRVPCYAAACC